VDECGPKDGVDCALVAIITDTDPDVLVLPNGVKLTRTHIPVGTRIAIPKNKIRKPAIPNPTERNVVFVRRGSGSDEVYCWEPVASL
jgi:hypothetical protein